MNYSSFVSIHRLQIYISLVFYCFCSHSLCKAAESLLSLFSVILDINDYDVTTEYDRFLIKRVDVEKKENNTVEVTPQAKGDWCDCFLPDSLTVTLRMVPNNGNVSAEPYEIPVTIGVKHKSVWIGRCLWALILMGALLLLFLFLLALLRKRRFKKNAQVTPVYYNRHGDEVDDGAGLRLRERGIAAWFARWFLPGREKRRLSFNDPECSVTFWASESPEIVEIPKDSIAPTMVFDNYDPESDATPSEPVKLGPGGQIQIIDAGGKNKGYLVFTPNSEQDGTGWRLLLTVFLIATAAAFAAVTIFLIRGLL